MHMSITKCCGQLNYVCFSSGDAEVFLQDICSYGCMLHLKEIKALREDTASVSAKLLYYMYILALILLSSDA